MHRIDTSTAQKDKFGVGKNGFTSGNPQTGVPASEVSADILDAMQEELCAVIEAAGMTLDKANNNQLLAAIQASIYPVGAPIPWSLATPPAGFLMMAGQAFSPATYPKLALAYPPGALPDLRGEFIRGWDNGRGVDTGRTLLSAQQHTVLDHSHNMIGMDRASQGGNFTLATEQFPILGKGFGSTTPEYPLGTSNNGYNNGTGQIKTAYNGAISALNVASETRPRNIPFNYIVRAA